MRRNLIFTFIVFHLFSKGQKPILFSDKNVSGFNYSQFLISDAKTFFKSKYKTKENHISAKPLGGGACFFTDHISIGFKKEGVSFFFERGSYPEYVEGNYPAYIVKEYALRTIVINKNFPNILTRDSLYVGKVTTLSSIGVGLADYKSPQTIKNNYGVIVKDHIEYHLTLISRDKLTLNTPLKIKSIIITPSNTGFKE
jgi:hypothetical protein